jgi:hypothetical protein
MCWGSSTFSSDGVEKVDTPKSAGDDRIDRVASTRNPDFGVPADMREYVPLPQFNQSQLGVVAVSKEVFCLIC